MGHGFQPGTISNHRVVASAYIRFCVLFDMHFLPCTGKQAHRFAQHLAHTIKSMDSVKNYMSNLRTIHQLAEIKPLDTQDYLYQLQIRGNTKMKSRSVKQATPITLQVLKLMHKYIQVQDTEQVAA